MWPPQCSGACSPPRRGCLLLASRALLRLACDGSVRGGGLPSAEGPGPARKEAWVSRCLAAAQHDAGGFACRGCGRVEWGGRTAGLKSGRRYISLDSSCAPESAACDLATPPCTGSPDPCMRRSAHPWGQTDPSGSRAGGYLRAQACAV